MTNKISRNLFLKQGAIASTGIGAVSLLGAGMMKSAKVSGNPQGFTWPWPYAILDPEVVRIKGHDNFWDGMSCCAGAFDAIIASLAVSLGDPFTNFPTRFLVFGHGGVAGWGTICGALNGAAAAISLVCNKATSDILIDELTGWYTLTKFPSDLSNQYAQEHTFGHTTYDMELAQGVCGSPLCHVSVTHWCNITNELVGSSPRKERCARLTGDVAAKAVELLNANLNGDFVKEYQTPAAVAACMTCHGTGGAMANVAMKQLCLPCHGPDPHSLGIGQFPKVNHVFTVKQNFPNPFNYETTIEFNLQQEERVTIEVYNLSGQHVKTLISDQSYPPGDHAVEWNGTDEYGTRTEAGMYLFRIRAGKAMKALTMMKM